MYWWLSIWYKFVLQRQPYIVPQWELKMNFDPEDALTHKNSIRWVNWKGSPLAPGQAQLDVLQEDWSSSNSNWQERLDHLPLRDPNSFVAGQLNESISQWHVLGKLFPYERSQTLLSWVEGGVEVADFFQHFKGNFNGVHYDSLIPPPVTLYNYSSCEKYGQEIADMLLDRLKNGSLYLWGKVGEVEPPWLVMPLVLVKGSRKDRLCHDERLLNLFMSSETFHLENLSLIPGLISEGDLMASSDEKSAYDGLMLSPGSRTFFGLQFGGYYMTYTTLPFGWSRSPLIYQSLGMLVTSFLREKGIITTQYLDDRFLGPSNLLDHASKEQSTGLSIFYSAATLSTLGYTLNEKSVWVPSICIRSLGFDVHSDSRHFSIPQEKIDAFSSLRESILSQEYVHVKVLQKLMGKCVSFSLCIPAAKLYIRCMARAVGKLEKSSQQVKIVGDLKQEIEHWRFLDGEVQWFSWRQERHVQVSLASDASGYAWGAKIGSEAIHDMWKTGDSRPIHLKETEALLKCLQSVEDKVKDKRIDAMVDNMALVKAWENEGSKDPEMVKLLKDLFILTRSLNCDLKLSYIASGLNPADEPSRRLGSGDAKLSQELWEKVEDLWGPHSFDLMALDSNAQKDKLGHSLPHYTPCSLPNSQGVNVLAQSLVPSENYYCFPPFCMVSVIVRFLLQDCSRPLRVSLVVPKQLPLPPWWPMLAREASIHRLAKAGDKGVVEYPTKKGYLPSSMKYDLFCARLRLV